MSFNRDGILINACYDGARTRFSVMTPVRHQYNHKRYNIESTNSLVIVILCLNHSRNAISIVISMTPVNMVYIIAC